VNWRNLFKKKRKDIKHIGNMAGHDFYVVFNPSELTYTRYFAYVQAVQLSGFKLLKEDLDICLDLIDKSISEGNIARIAHITDAIRGYQNLYLSNDLMKEVVNCFILIDDEPLEKFSTSHTQTKLSLYDNNLQIRFFFYQFCNGFAAELGEFTRTYSARGILEFKSSEAEGDSLLEGLEPEKWINALYDKIIETTEETNEQTIRSSKVLGVTDEVLEGMSLGRYLESLIIHKKIQPNGREHIRSDSDNQV
jgi:hypothetical protein